MNFNETDLYNFVSKCNIFIVCIAIVVVGLYGT